MPRIARVVVPEMPHHVTQRGNYQQKVFMENTDRKLYLKWIKEYSERYGLRVWAYCLMDNHVHFVVVPQRMDSMAKTFNQAHMRYSQYINHEMGRRGHLWQGRFYSCLLDDSHLYTAIRYVENNPVRVGIVKRAEDYAWSSCRSHVLGLSDPVLSSDLPILNEISDWREYLGMVEEKDMVERLRECTSTGRPTGSKAFVRRIERLLERELIPQPIGRPRKRRR